MLPFYQAVVRPGRTGGEGWEGRRLESPQQRSWEEGEPVEGGQNHGEAEERHRGALRAQGGQQGRGILGPCGEVRLQMEDPRSHASQRPRHPCQASESRH